MNKRLALFTNFSIASDQHGETDPEKTEYETEEKSLASAPFSGSYHRRGQGAQQESDPDRYINDHITSKKKTPPEK